MALIVPDDLMQASGLSEAELRQELAVALFREQHLSLGQAAALAMLAPGDFMDVLSARNVQIPYDVEDLERDVETLRKIARG